MSPEAICISSSWVAISLSVTHFRGWSWKPSDARGKMASEAQRAATASPAAAAHPEPISNPRGPPPSHQEGKHPHVPAAPRCHRAAAHQGPVNQILPKKKGRKATCSPLPACFRGVLCSRAVVSAVCRARPHAQCLLVCVGAAGAAALWDIQLPPECCSRVSLCWSNGDGGVWGWGSGRLGFVLCLFLK